MSDSVKSTGSETKDSEHIRRQSRLEGIGAKVRTDSTRDVCDDTVGAFVMSLSRKVHGSWQKPSLAWKKAIPMLIFAVKHYNGGQCPQNILENICRIFNNLVRGDSVASNEYRDFLSAAGCIEILMDVLRESSNNGKIPSRTRYCAAQALQYISTTDKWRNKICDNGGIATLVKLMGQIPRGQTVRGEIVGILMNLASEKGSAVAIIKAGGLKVAADVLACRAKELNTCIAHTCGMVANLALFPKLKIQACTETMDMLLKLCKNQDDILVLVNSVVAIKNIVHEQGSTAKFCARRGGALALRQALDKISSHADASLLFDNPSSWLPYLIDRVRMSHASARRAIIIANEYQDEKHPWRSLMSSKDNAWALQTALENAGFDCTILVNASKKRMEMHARKFIEKMTKGDTVLVYYFGMGCQMGGKSYLLPVDIPAYHRKQEAMAHLFSLDNMLAGIECKAGVGCAKIILLEVSKFKFGNLTGRQGLGEEAITSINANKFGKNWFIISSSADPLAASDQDVPGQYSAFTHSLICGINSSSLDLLGVGKFVSKKYAACAKQFGKSQAPFVTSSMTGDFFFHKRLEDASNKMRMSDGIKDADEEIERAFRQQRYSGLRVLSMNEGDGSMDQVYMSPPNIAGIPRRARPSRRPPPPPGPGGGNYLSPNAQRRIPKPRTLVHGPKNGPLSTDGPQTKPLHLSDVYREERVAHGALEFVQSHNVHANGQADTNAASHWLGTLRR